MTGESIVYLAKEWGQEHTSCDAVFEQLARSNTVLWVNSIATRSPNLTSLHDWRRILSKLRRCLGGLTKVGPNAWLYQPLFIPLPHSELARSINRRLLQWALRRQTRRLNMQHPQLWMLQPNGAFLAGHLDESIVVYYCTDEWSQFAHLDGEKVAALERELLQKSDLCFVASEPLLRSKRPHNPNTYLSLHGVDYEQFAKALDPDTLVPADVASFPRPVVGFFGGIREHIDCELIVAMAKRHPEWSIVLIGTPWIPVDDLRARPNVHLLGRRPYESLPNYCKAFDVGIIPYRQNEFIRHVNPIKLRQYLSAGLPVVSTPMFEVERMSHLATVARDPEEFIRGIEKALETDTPLQRGQRSEAMQEERWEAKVAKLCDLVMRQKENRIGNRSNNLVPGNEDDKIPAPQERGAR